MRLRVVRADVNGVLPGSVTRMAACPEYLVLAFRSGLVNEIEVP